MNKQKLAGPVGGGWACLLVNRLVNEIGSSLRMVFGQSEDGSRLCNQKHLPVVSRGGPK